MKLQTKLISLILLMLFLVAGIAVSFVYIAYLSGVKGNVLSQLMSEISHDAEIISGNMGERYADLRMMAEDPAIASGKADPDMISAKLESHREAYGIYADISYFDPDGKKLGGTKKTGLGRPYALKEHMDEILASEEVVTKVSRPQELGQPDLNLGFAIRDKAGNPLGFVVAVVPSGSLHFRHDFRQDFSFPEMKLDVIDSRGDLVYSNHRTGIAAKNEIARFFAFRSRLNENKAGWTVEKEGPEKSGAMNVYVFTRLPGYLDFTGSGWFITAQMPFSSVLLPAVQLRGKMVTVLFPFMVMAILIAVFFARNISLPIIRLRDAAIEVGKGRLDTRIDIETGDETGELAGAFNRMIAELNISRKELLREKTYVEGILSSMVDSMFVVDRDGSIRTVNAALLKIADYSEDEVTGRPASMLFAERFPFRGEAFENMIASGYVSGLFLTLVTKYGEKIPVDVSGSAMYESQGSHKARTGIVVVARDTRRIKELISKLEKANVELEEFSRNLEKKIEERTKDLVDSQEATLSILEDLDLANTELERSYEELQKAKEEIEEFSKGLEEKVEKRTFELSVLYEVSNAISYTLDYRQLLQILMESLLKVVDYDVCMALLFDQHAANITSKAARPVMSRILNRIQDRLIEDITGETGENIHKKRLGTFYIPPPEYVDAAKGVSAEISEVRSSFNTPFIVRGKTIGAINLSSHKEKAFSAEDIKLVHTLANLASNAIERLQTVITAEKSKMERMVESMLEGVIMTDESGEIAVINPRGKMMLDIKGDEAVSTELVVKKLKQADLYESYIKSKEEENLVTKEINALYDPERFLSCDIFPVKDPEGNVSGTVIVLRDITREKEVDKMKTEFVATVSHELRTPLTTVREATSQVLDGVLGDTTDWQKDILRISLADIDRLKRIINSLLDISKIEAGRIQLAPELVDVVGIAKEVGVSFAAQIDSKKLEFRERFSSSSITAYVDKDRINQVFTNLVANAVKFTNRGHIEIGIIEHEDKLECYVADTGIGISKEDIPLVFTKFRQFGRKSGPGEKGTGLGLSISRGIVELHNGRIWAESEQGKGSKFTFILPKYNKYEILCNNIERRIADARKERKELALLFFRVDNYTAIEKSLGKDRAGKILLKMASALRKETRAGEYLESDNNNEVMLVLDGGKENALKISERLKRTIAKAVSDAGEEGVKLVAGCAGYPEDGNSAHDLIEEVKRLGLTEKGV